MIETKVRVLSTGRGMAWVEATEQNGCGACQAKSACAISGLGRFFSSRRQPIPVCADGAQAGREYTVAIEESDFLKAGLVAYLIPSLLAVLGAVIASANHMGDAWAVVGMALGFLVGMLLATLLSGGLAAPIAMHATPESISLTPSPSPARGRGELRASLRDVHMN